MTQNQSKAEKLATLYANLDTILAGNTNKPVLPMGTDDHISKVKLSENDVASVLESVVPGYKPTEKKVESQKDKPAAKVQEEISSPEDKIRDLITKLTTLLREARVVIAEMTTTGMIGTNQKFVLGQKKKKLQKSVKKVK